MLCALNTPERSVIEAAQATSGEWLGDVLGRLKVRSAAGPQVPQLAHSAPLSGQSEACLDRRPSARDGRIVQF
jgi:hypothetical protein